MNKYILMQAPKQNEDDYAPQIVIVDNTTHIGKRKIERLINDGYSHIGYIESELRPQQLKSGFNHNSEKRLDGYQEQMQKIYELTMEPVDEH